METNRVYVGNLAYSVYWYDLKDFMRSAGEVLHANVLRSHNGQSRGCGIVEFATPADAQKAIHTLNNVELKGRPVFIREDREAYHSFVGSAPTSSGPPSGAPSTSAVASSNPPVTAQQTRAPDEMPTAPAPQPVAQPVTQVAPQPAPQSESAPQSAPQPTPQSVPQAVPQSAPQSAPQQQQQQPIAEEATASNSTTLQQAAKPGFAVFVGNLPFSITWQQLKQLFGLVGEVLRADIHVTPQRRSRGHGTVVFADEEMGRKAIQQFTGYNLNGRIIEVREDKPASERPAAFLWCSGHGEPSDVVHVSNLPWTTTDNDLLELFQSIAPVSRAQLQNFPDGRFSGCGVVRFQSQASAELAVKQLNGYTYGLRELHVSYARYPPS